MLRARLEIFTVMKFQVAVTHLLHQYTVSQPRRPRLRTSHV